MRRLTFGQLEELLEDILKPARYTGNEIHCPVQKTGRIKDPKQHVFMALLFPDIYEIGMSNLGLKILYEEINRHPDFTAERAFLPWIDFEKRLKERSVPLFSLENRIFLHDFDILGFSIAHEMLYTNVLNMLELSGIGLRADQRKERSPLVCAGGASVANPMPFSDFMDFFVIGDGEEVIIKILEEVAHHKKSGAAKADFLEKISAYTGIFVPSLYQKMYSSGTEFAKKGPLKKVKKAVVKDINRFGPVHPIIANTKPVHDRLVLEIMRGCPRKCAFCQARTVYSPLRLKDPDVLAKQCITGIKNTGYDEVSFLSLSTSDYKKINEVITQIKRESDFSKLSISLPSLRLDSFSLQVAKAIQTGRKTGLTFAPEAGSQRLRDIIHKDIDSKEMIECIKTAFVMGWEKIKLYFMIGLPFEETKDIEGITDTVYAIMGAAKETMPKNKMGRLHINVSVNAFCPKPHTPFQWARQDSTEELKEKFDIIRKRFPKRHASLSWSVPEKSMVESALSRGDASLCAVIEQAYRLGAKLDNWTDHFDYGKWEEAFQRCGLDLEAYATRDFALDSVLAWDMIDIGVSKAKLVKEYQRAQELSYHDGRDEDQV
jgi:radical SAM family uncharacterized protein